MVGSGVSSANKFLQKIWNLNFLIINRKEPKSVTEEDEMKFSTKINYYANKIDSAIKEFKFNVAIANFYEVYNFFRNQTDAKIKNKILIENITKIMKLLIPFAPHLAYECLETLKCKTVNKWPEIKKNTIDEVKLAIQINGKTRDIISIDKDLMEKDINNIVFNNTKTKKYFEGKKVKRTIFVKNKIINYLL